MWRTIHSWTGLLLSLLVSIMALTGVVLATLPIYNHYLYHSNNSNLTVAKVVQNIAQYYHGRVLPIELNIAPNGSAKLTFQRKSGSIPAPRAINLETGKFENNPRLPDVYDFTEQWHEKWFYGKQGQYISDVAIFTMAIFILTGLMLLVRRLGGWRSLLQSIRWNSMGNMHSSISRIVFIPLLILTVSGIWLAMVNLNWVGSGDAQPAKTIGSQDRADKPGIPWELPGLQAIPMTQVTKISYPISDDPTDSWTVYTTTAVYSIDQYSGRTLLVSPLPWHKQLYNWMLFLHTGQGNITWAIILLLTALSVPFFAFSGIWVWLKNRLAKGGRIRHNATKKQAQIVILVGSESHTTWGFARALHAQLHQAGYKTHITEMNNLSNHYAEQAILLVLTATYGDGVAPQSAARFMSRLQRWQAKSGQRFAVLGFGDKSFPHFCAFAQACQTALVEHLPSLLPLTLIDKCNAQSFTRWGTDLGQALGIELAIHHELKRPQTAHFTLVHKTNYGEDIGALKTVLRFKANHRLPAHVAGDLISVYPPQCATPRLYSLGSSRQDGFVEFCVRYQEGGLCSPWLCQLNIGDTIDANIVQNPRFHAPRGRQPLILVGAGTGIGPLVGFIRQNHHHRPIWLFWGGRDPHSDALYASEIETWKQEKRLTHFFPAWSRYGDQNYVQDVIRSQSSALAPLLQQGATIMVCGSIVMAQGVRDALNDVIALSNTSLEKLKRQNRYLEDVY